MTLRELTEELRALNAEIDGPWTVYLTVDYERWECGWGFDEYGFGNLLLQFGKGEELPGDNRPFDAVAAARRMLASFNADERAYLEVEGL